MLMQPSFLISAPFPGKQGRWFRCIGLLVWSLGRQKWVSCRSGCDLSATARDSGLPQRDRQPGWQLLTMTTFMPSDTGMEDSSVGWACTQLTAWCHGLCLHLRGHTVFWANLSPEAGTDSQHWQIKRMLHHRRPWLLTWACLTGCKVTSEARERLSTGKAWSGWKPKKLFDQISSSKNIKKKIKYHKRANQHMEGKMVVVQQLVSISQAKVTVSVAGPLWGIITPDLGLWLKGMA